ncbi:hypothetical protein L1887_34322 [Cichorium endivia]|nr:hypothetical protein L1887_34322 [Cichorium endivia]
MIAEALRVRDREISVRNFKPVEKGATEMTIGECCTTPDRAVLADVWWWVRFLERRCDGNGGRRKQR